MKFRTEIEIPKSPWQIGYKDKIALLGSCFSDNIARKLEQYSFQVLRPTSNNVSGLISNSVAVTLYNPVSIARHMSDEIVQNADVFIITFGTAWVYIDKKTQQVVDNCEKRPASDFIRQRLSVGEIVEIWQPVIEKHADKRFIFTVSPIRHLKDGLHENNLSKSILLLAIEQLYNIQLPTAQRSKLQYFPSYELLLDDLRDYRFYADDLMHPASAAVEYIWERFVATYMSESTQAEMKDLFALWLNRNHRSLHPGSPEDLQFKARTEEQFRTLKSKYPWI